MVDEACWGDGADGVSEYGCVWGDKGFEIAWCWCWSTAAGVEVLGNDFLHETRIVVELLAHVVVCIVAGHPCLVASFYDKLETLVEFIFDLFSVLEVFLRILLEKLQLLVTIYLMLEPTTVI